MEWPEDLASELPANRGDEPAELRRRIIAELRDHLDSALQRELLRTGDAAQARQNVLFRFGDPARLARKLWFDAMWEKIMMQRGMLVAIMAMVVVSAGSMGLTWFMVVQAGQVNKAILAKLEALGNPKEPHGKSTDWNPLKFRVTCDKSDGAPVAGVKIAIQGQDYGTISGTGLERTTGPDGIADFGLVKTGQYLVNVETPWGEATADTTSVAMGFLEIGGQMITVLPGQTQPQELVCPSQPHETEISLAIDWPQESSGLPLWLVCEFAQQPREVGGHKWARSKAQPQIVVVDSAGHMTTPDLRGFGRGTASGRPFFPETGSMREEEESRFFVGQSKSFVDVPGIYSIRKERKPSRERDYEGRASVYVWLPKSAAISQLNWPAGTYTVSRLFVARDAESVDESLPDDLLHPEFLGAIELADSTEDSDKLVFPDQFRARASRRKRREVKADLPPFEALPGRHNEWRLPVPPRLVDILTEPKPVIPELREADAAEPEPDEADAVEPEPDEADDVGALPTYAPPDADEIDYPRLPLRRAR